MPIAKVAPFGVQPIAVRSQPTGSGVSVTYLAPSWPEVKESGPCEPAPPEVVIEKAERPVPLTV